MRQFASPNASEAAVSGSAIQSLTRIWPQLTALLLGLSLTLSYAPFGYWWWMPLALTGLLALISQLPLSRLTSVGWWFGAGWFGAGVSWVHVSIDQFGGLPLIGSLTVMALLTAYLALYPMLGCWLLSKLLAGRTLHLASLGAVIGALFTLTEWLRGHLFTGFGWLSVGYSQTTGPLAKLAPLIGEVGISMALWLIAGQLLWLCQALFQILWQARLHPRLQPRSLLSKTAAVQWLSFVALVVAAQTEYIHATDKTVKIALIQGNIKQELRWAPELAWPTMLKYLDLTRPHWDADIVIWPESAVPELEHAAQDFLQMLDKAAQYNNSSVVTGIVDYQIDGKAIYNALIVLGRQHPEPTSSATSNTPSTTNSPLPADDTSNEPSTQGPNTSEINSVNSGESNFSPIYQAEFKHSTPLVGPSSYAYGHRNRYLKHHLLPIGEFIPFEQTLRGIAPLFDLPMSSFTRGDYKQPPLIANGYQLQAAICYEIAFADQVAANFAPSHDFILTVSNDAWFGHSIGPLQHMQIAQMRALELGRPVLRATNNGVTGVILPNGQQHTIAQFTQAVLTSDVAIYRGETPYSRWPQWPIYGLACLILAVALASYRCKNRIR